MLAKNSVQLCNSQNYCRRYFYILPKKLVKGTCENRVQTTSKGRFGSQLSYVTDSVTMNGAQ